MNVKLNDLTPIFMDIAEQLAEYSDNEEHYNFLMKEYANKISTLFLSKSHYTLRNWYPLYQFDNDLELAKNNECPFCNSPVFNNNKFYIGQKCTCGAKIVKVR